MEGIVKKVKDKYFFILIPDTRQIFGHVSSWLSYPGPRLDDLVEFDLVVSLKPQYQHQATNVKRIGSITSPETDTAGRDALAKKADTQEAN
jgi:hypothetical protein